MELDIKILNPVYFHSLMLEVAQKSSPTKGIGLSSMTAAKPKTIRQLKADFFSNSRNEIEEDKSLISKL